MLWQDLFVELSRIKMANGECITKNIIAGQKNIADPKLLLIHDMDYDAGVMCICQQMFNPWKKPFIQGFMTKSSQNVLKKKHLKWLTHANLFKVLLDLGKVPKKKAFLKIELSHKKS